MHCLMKLRLFTQNHSFTIKKLKHKELFFFLVPFVTFYTEPDNEKAI